MMENKTADRLKRYEDTKRKVAKYYGYEGDWDRLCTEWEHKTRDGITGLPNVYIDRALEFASQQCLDMQAEIDRLRRLLHMANQMLITYEMRYPEDDDCLVGRSNAEAKALIEQALNSKQ